MNLRDSLLAVLADLPGAREFHIHVLVSSPRKHGGLFPYAHPRPRAYLQDILILLSEQVTPDLPRVLVTAIEASIYNVPITSCGILYISKVDSSGHASKPSPTAALVRSLITFYCDPNTRPINVDHFWIQLFARAQGQYLFPNSSDFAGKRPLADVQLCIWWKRILSDVADELNTREQGRVKIRLFYVLPGSSELEAVHSLSVSPSQPSSGISTEHPWVYGHPYSQADIPLPCPKTGGPPDLGHLIPSFDDDPKSRFMDEIAHTTDAEGVGSPKAKRSRTSRSHPAHVPSDETSRDDEDEDEHDGELTKVTPDEFWERMSFRQECISGVVTAFFAVGISSQATDRTSTNISSASAPSPLAPQPGQVPPRMVRRIVASLLNHHEFSTTERAVRATETLEGAIKGLCEGLASVPESLSLSGPHKARLTTPEPELSKATLEVPRTPPRRPGKPYISDISPNPFPEPVTSLDTYCSYIYGGVSVKNPPLPSKAEENASAPGQRTKEDNPAPRVTVLAVRKKRKAAT